jgi:AraC-like DNA-binding protein
MKKCFSFILFVCLCLISSNISGQSEIDSLKNIFNTAKTPAEKLDAALELTDKLTNEKNDETKKYLDITQEILNENPDSLKQARLNTDYGYYFIYTGDYIKASDYFLEGIKISEKIGNVILKNKLLNGLALLNLRTKNYKKAITIYKKLVEYSKQTKNEHEFFMYSLNLAMAYGEDGNFDDAEKLLIKLYNSDLENKFYKAVAANTLSFIYNHSEQYKKALKYGQVVAEFSKTFPDMRFRVEALTNYSNALKGLGENVKAGKMMKEIYLLAKKNKFVIKMNNAIGNLALNYEALGDYKSAYKYYKDFSERRDSLLNESTTAKINELQIKYETAKKDKEIQEKNASLKQKNLMLTLTISGSILFVLIAFIIFILYRNKNEAYKELVRKNLEIIKCEKKPLTHRKQLIVTSKYKYESSSLSQEKKEELNAKLTEIINEEKVFLQSDISLGKLAQKLDVNSKYLSQVVHEFHNSSFSDFINQLRIKEAARLLSDEAYRHISMEGISEMVGFNTKSSFNTYFKKFIGVTPSFFSSTSQNIS